MSGTNTPTVAPPPFIVYSTFLLSTGRITGTLSCSPGQATAASSTVGELAGVFDPGTYYVDTTQSVPVATLRPAMGVTVDKTAIAANGQDFATFSGVPSAATVSVDGAAPVPFQAPTTFSASDAGTYTVTISDFPALDATFQIVAS